MSISEKSTSSLTVGYERKEQVRCMLCGGKECSKCGLDAYKKVASPAIELLHSHWITDNIVGMQRPNETSLHNGALADMVKKKFTAVFNLTEPGEHPFCGCGNLAVSGFPYLPETFMSHGIKHFNFNWRDMTVPTLEMMDRIVAIACTEIQSGGKIAVHCHAGFGRTGLAIACILIANDHLPADSVVTFVRNRRPGSIQTKAQQQFIHRYEKHRKLMMQVFPTYEEVDESKLGHPKGKSFVAYPKTIAVSVDDQRHFFSTVDQEKSEYRYVHKVVYLSSRAISRLSFDQFSVACLAITGLNKLTVKRNSIDGRDSDAVAARAEALTSRPQLMRKKSSFMVATNSLSESSEESMLTEIKLELNQNNFVRTTSLAEVISADFRARGQSLSRMEQRSRQIMDVGSTSFRTTLHSSSQRDMGTREGSHAILTREPSYRVATPPPNYGHGHGGGLHPGAARNEANLHVHPRHPEHGQPHHLSTELHHHHPPQQHPHQHPHLQADTHPHHGHDDHDKPLTAGNHPTHTRSSSRLQDAPKTPSQENGPSVSPPAGGRLNGAGSTTNLFSPISGATSKSNLHEGAIGGGDVGGTGTTTTSRPQSSNGENGPSGTGGTAAVVIQKERSVSPAVPRISLPSPGSLIRGLSAKSMNNDNSQSNMSGNNTQRSNASTGSVASPLTAIRANSLRMNTEQDYAKSKKMAANLMAQLLLDWLETRADSLLSADDVDALQDIWAKYGGIPKVTEERLEEDGSSSRSVSDKGGAAATTASAVPVASSPGEIQDDFYEDELIQAIYSALAQRLSRYKLELLSTLVEMYRFIRLAGFDYTVKLQSKPPEQTSTTHSPKNGTGGGHSGSASSSSSSSAARNAELAGSETQALDALVGLRIAIACMHARKKNSNLVRRRGLIIDLVKVFLLKSSSSEYVIINNITFSAENFAQIQYNIGIVLLGQIDVVFRTLNLLVDTQWSSSYKKVRGKHRGRMLDANRVGWRDVNGVQEFTESGSQSDR